jgi:hypothetical protein
MDQNQPTLQHAAAHMASSIPVKYRLYRDNPIFDRQFNVGRSRDLSLNDLLLAVGRHSTVNTNLDMELDFAQGQSAYVVGKVVEGVDELINGIVHHFDRIVFAKLDKDAEDLIVKQINADNKRTH